MELTIDKNNILCIENENIPKTKEYFYNVGGYNFSDYDKGIIVYHKKQIKIINLKNLGNGMSIFYIKNNKYPLVNFEKTSFVSGLCNYKGFDENTGQSYFFIPKFHENIEKFNNMLNFLLSDIYLEKKNKGLCVSGNLDLNKNDNINFINQIFAFILLYGKFDSKNDELISFKFHLPLFGSFLGQKDYLDEHINKLEKQGLFVKKNIIESNDGIIYQVSSNDYELLQILAKLYEPIAKFDKIHKYEQILEIKKSLLEFIKTDKQIPESGKKETIKKIENGIIKLLAK
ncbi:MAG: hypothetical protein WC872_00860 [Candidatus Absconditabacterales bacterium]